MSSTDNFGEAWEKHRQPLKGLMPRSAPSVPGQSSGMNSTTDSPMISNTEISSPFGEGDHSSPHLRIDTTREVNNESNDFNPLTASLDTGGLGKKYFEEETFQSFDYFDPLASTPLDADNQLEHDEETYRILKGAPGTEDTLGSTEEGPGLDLDPNGPNFGGLFANAPSQPALLDPTVPQPYEDSRYTSNDAHHSIPSYPNTDLVGFNSSFTAAQTPDNGLVSGSNSWYSQGGLQSNLTQATAAIQGMSLAQLQELYSNTQSPHTHSHQLLNPPLSYHKRRSISDASVFLQPEHHNRTSTPHALRNTSTLRDQGLGGFHGGDQTVTVDPGFEELPYSYNFGFPGHGNDGVPVSNAHYPHTQLTEHDEYPARGWQHGNQEHHGGPDAQPNATEVVAQGGFHGGPTEIPPSQFPPADSSQVRDALPQRQIPEGDTMFDSINDAKRWRQRHLVHPDKHDFTIPKTPAEQKHVVRRMVEAINDTDDAMPSQSVRYFIEHKYSPEQIESTCWMILEACITRHMYGPLQTEEERTAGKIKVIDYDTVVERIDNVIRGLRIHKSICKQLLEPHRLFQFVDAPALKMKRTENNKTLNDRKAGLIAAGKAVGGDARQSRARRGKQKSVDEEESDNSYHGVADTLTGLSSAPRGLRMASATTASVRSTPGPSAGPITRKRKLESAISGNDSTLRTEYSSPFSKKARTGSTPSTIAPKPVQGQPQGTYQLHSHGAAFGQRQSFEQPNASVYGNPSTGGIQGAPYFTQRSNAQRQLGQAYPEIEGYHTQSIRFGPQPTFDDGSAVGHDTVRGQRFPNTSRPNTAITDEAMSSTFNVPPTNSASNPYSLAQESTRGQLKRQLETDDEGSEFELSQAKPKRRRNA